MDSPRFTTTRNWNVPLCGLEGELDIFERTIISFIIHLAKPEQSRRLEHLNEFYTALSQRGIRLLQYPISKTNEKHIQINTCRFYCSSSWQTNNPASMRKSQTHPSRLYQANDFTQFPTRRGVRLNADHPLRREPLTLRPVENRTSSNPIPTTSIGRTRTSLQHDGFARKLVGPRVLSQGFILAYALTASRSDFACTPMMSAQHDKAAVGSSRSWIE